ncbi:L-aspartate oxidase [Saccharophagus degradans]|uniref:L-aspartate oxidase n=1 Tax=Saccharophagus degradans TaxID=86304 RepID=A0AAW7X1Y8_9GAMM|nr:L-aspartate oxidase [Saccharophagus degradans]MBU2985926.1 L-aspartate oxidase [Saccharophagus degradans]MDO6420937.1 L-aspartate oxidase [Saccharophagus degradans]MDO6606152.1 L-aspartate oxidase [Saccharophagus degradans]WGP00254.1 L-aspartate oxidase [Saccharophagus degradans]
MKKAKPSRKTLAHPSQTHNVDVLVIGSGAAGLTLALNLAGHCKVAVLSKGNLRAGSTWYAQGGIAAVLDNNDSVESHVKDTLVAGAGLCHEDAVDFTVRNSKSAIEWLINLGVNFTRNEDSENYHLTREGGHSHRRIIHSADATGKAVHTTLLESAQVAKGVELFENYIALDLIRQPDPNSKRLRCTGAYVFNRHQDRVELFNAKAVVLATGGASKVYLYTSNPDSATGDGIAMAWRAGCRVANMEFNQFHPTCLYHPKAKTFLITEALRGEGAKLRLPDGSQFMHNFHSLGELAPRDVVARAIDHEMKRLGSDCLYLDISHRTPEFIESHFPTVREKCLEFGIDITKEPIPVVPAAHYTCGGVVVNNKGQTDLLNLYAIGETSFTGLHGANRMASNSLLECIVYARSASESILATLNNIAPPQASPQWDESRVTNSDEDVVISHNWDELRRFMWDYVGIVRTHKRLERATHRIKLLQKEINDYYSNYKVSNDLIELRNLAVAAELIIRSAIQRRESRGLHYSLDYPELSPIAQDTILVPMNYAAQNIIVHAPIQ